MVKRVAMEALSLKGKGRWWENLERCLADLGWGDVRLDSVKDMSNVKYMLQNCAWREEVVGGGVGGAAKAVCSK